LQVTRSDPEKDGLLPRRFSESSNRELLNSSQPAVGDPEAVARGPGTEVPLFHQGYPEVSQTRVPGDRGPVDSAADDQEIEMLALEPGHFTSHRAMIAPVRVYLRTNVFNVRPGANQFGELHRIFRVTLRTDGNTWED
jgi:hypothetical protein